MDSGFVPDNDDRGARHERSDPRDSMLLQATMRVDGGAAKPLRVRNLSAGGLMGEGGPALWVGQQVAIELRNVGVITGKVAWKEEARFGVAFDRPIDPQLARKPVATLAPRTELIPPVRVKPRRPGLKPE